MNPVKVLAIMSVLLGVLCVCLNNETPVRSIASEALQDSGRENGDQKVALAQQFAQSLAQQPGLVNTIQGSTPQSSSPQGEAIAGSLDNAIEAFASGVTTHEHRAILFSRKAESISLVKNVYLSLDSHTEPRRSNMLRLFIDLCREDTASSCEEVLAHESINDDLLPSQQLDSINAYLTLGGLSEDQKQAAVARYNEKRKDAERSSSINSEASFEEEESDYHH